MREAGPDVECPFTADVDGVMTLIEELGNPANQANGTTVDWWFPVAFGTKGGLLSVGDVACTPAPLTVESNATCSEGYDCGGCPMLFDYWDKDGKQSAYLRPQDWDLDACADLAGYYGIHAGAEPPVHACDLEYPQGCQCAGDTPVSAYKGALSQDGLFCSPKDEPDPRDKSGTNDSCAHRYVCGTGETPCEAWISTAVDRDTGEQTFFYGSNCPGVATGNLHQAASCPDYAAEASACSSCIDACAGVPECHCDSECATSKYSCAM